MFNNQLKDYLLKLYGTLPVEPISTAANIARAIPESAQLISDEGQPLPQRPSAPPETISSAPVPVQTPPTPVAKPPTLPQVQRSPVETPVAPPAQESSLKTNPAVLPAPAQPNRAKYDDVARQQLYDELANKRRQNAGWAAVGDVADLNANVGKGTQVKAGDTIRENMANSEKTAKADFEAGRTALVGEQDRQIAAQDKRDALKAALEAKREAAQLRSDDRRFQLGMAKDAKDLTLGTKESQFRDGQTQKFRDTLQRSKPYQNLQTMNQLKATAEQSVKDPSPYNDLQLIYATVKALDPNSVVREGEIKLFQATANIKNQIQGALSTAIQGQPLTPDQKANIMTLISQLEKTNKEVFLRHEAPTLAQAKRLGLKLDEIDPMLANLEAPEAQATGLTPEKKARMAELRAKQANGTLR